MARMIPETEDRGDPRKFRSPNDSSNTLLIDGTNYVGIPYNSDTYASDTRAELARRDFDRFLTTFKPVLERQVRQFENPAYLQQQVGQARIQVRNSLEAAEGTRSRAFRTNGITPSAEESAVTRKGDQLRGSLADVTAINRTTQNVRDRDLQILTGIQPPKYGAL